MYYQGPASTGRGPRTVARYDIGFGDLGSYQTLGAMRQVVLESEASPVVVETAADIVRYVAPRDRAGQIAAIRAWLKRKLQFLNDPLHTELLRTPEYMLARIHSVGVIQADCDDAAILAAALCCSIGIPARFVAGGFSFMGPLLHVWAEANDGSSWVELDITRPEGVPLATVRRREFLEV